MSRAAFQRNGNSSQEIGYHSGQQITNVARNTVEGGPPRTCAGSLEGTLPWGPATEQRFPVIDPERGLVFAVTLLHYLQAPTPSQMYVSEVFKLSEGASSESTT